MVPSEAQSDACALIAYYEGADVACEVREDGVAVCEAAGHRWTVDRHASRLYRDGTYLGDYASVYGRAVARNTPDMPDPELLDRAERQMWAREGWIPPEPTDTYADAAEELRTERRDSDELWNRLERV